MEVITGNKVCCIHGCTNKQREPENIIKKSHVATLKWHRVPRESSSKNALKRHQWVTMIKKGRKNFNPGNETFVCSNHFVDGEPTQTHPYPTLSLKSANSEDRKPPTQRRSINEWPSKKQLLPADVAPIPIPVSPIIGIHSALCFSHFTREADVKFYTGLPGTSHFNTLFQYVKQKALRLNYWRGQKRLSTENKGDDDVAKKRPGP